MKNVFCLVLVVVFVIAMVGFTIYVDILENERIEVLTNTTDEMLMNAYIDFWYGKDCSGELYPADEEGMVRFMVFDANGERDYAAREGYSREELVSHYMVHVYHR